MLFQVDVAWKAKDECESVSVFYTSFIYVKFANIFVVHVYVHVKMLICNVFNNISEVVYGPKARCAQLGPTYFTQWFCYIYNHVFNNNSKIL